MSVTLQNVLYGIAVADAIGNPLEFRSNPTQQDFDGSSQQKIIRISDDTQMTLFLAEALIKAPLGSTDILLSIKEGYLRWFYTQGRNIPYSSGLLQFGSLFNVEAPGNTCMNSCSSLLRGREVMNDSKGNGTVMRCAPIAFWAVRSVTPLHTAVEAAYLDAKLTHLHPYAAQSSMLLIAIYRSLIDGLDFGGAVNEACRYLRDLSLVDSSVSSLVLDSLTPSTHDAMKKSLGGWVAEEALALAVGSVARADIYVDAIRHATVIIGDSDTVGGIAGGLAAASGMKVPPILVNKLNARDAIDYVAHLYSID